jgi:hypothetical protein
MENFVQFFEYSHSWELNSKEFSGRRLKCIPALSVAASTAPGISRAWQAARNFSSIEDIVVDTVCEIDEGPRRCSKVRN